MVRAWASGSGAPASAAAASAASQRAAGLLQPPQPHQRVALGGQQPRALRAGVAGQQRQRPAVVLQRALVVPEVMLAEPLVEQRRPDGLARRVDLAERGERELHRALRGRP